MHPIADSRILPNPEYLQSFLMENDEITSLSALPGIEYKRDTNGNFADVNVEYLEKATLKEKARVINKWMVELPNDGSTSASAIMQDAGVQPMCYTIANSAFLLEEVHAYLGTRVLVHAPEVLPLKDEQSIKVAIVYTIKKWLSKLLKKARRLSVHTRIANVVHARRSTLDTQHQMSWERTPHLQLRDSLLRAYKQ